MDSLLASSVSSSHPLSTSLHLHPFQFIAGGVINIFCSGSGIYAVVISFFLHDVQFLIDALSFVAEFVSQVEHTTSSEVNVLSLYT